MSRQRRFFLICLGLAIVLGSLAILGHTLWPAEVLRVQATLAPTVFVNP
jgi:hypothetical protein